MLGNVSQQYVSKLVRKGELVVEKDRSGANQYDRECVETYARRMAFRNARDSEDAEEKKAQQSEARDRFARKREEERRLEEERRRWEDDLREREVKALEGIVKCLSQRS